MTTKLISLLLIVGGIAGAVGSAWTVFSQEAKPWMTVALQALFILIFLFSTWTGLDLWRAKPRAYKWAKILFFLQIPNISTSGFVYQFYTALMFGLGFTREAEAKLGLEFQLGSAIVFFIPGKEGLILGVNLIAIAALVYLAKVSRDKRTLETTGQSAT